MNSNELQLELIGGNCMDKVAMVKMIISRSGKHRDALRKATAHGEESSKTGKESGNSPKESTSFIME